MKIAVVGSRDYPDLNQVRDYIMNMFDPAIDVLVSGHAAGVDSMAELTANRLGIKKIIFSADWHKFGRGVGFARNKLIVKECDRLVAFWHNGSRGTENTINEALKANKKIDLFRSDEEVPF